MRRLHVTIERCHGGYAASMSDNQYGQYVGYSDAAVLLEALREINRRASSGERAVPDDIRHLAREALEKVGEQCDDT